MTALDGLNLDTRGICEQLSAAKKIALRLVSPTIFEARGWKRIQAIPLALKSFKFDEKTAKVTFDEIELPISIGNKYVVGGQTVKKTFLVSVNVYDLIIIYNNDLTKKPLNYLVRIQI